VRQVVSDAQAVELLPGVLPGAAAGGARSAKLFYYAGGVRIAVRPASDNVARWILSDHLGSTAKTVSSGGSTEGEQRYMPFGLDRYTTGSLNTAYRFTGQRIEDNTDLYFYQSRWYDPVVGRFIQPDSIVPEPGNPQSLNRYSYTINNPLKYTDPTGHAYALDLEANYRMAPNGRLLVSNPLQGSLGALIDRVRGGAFELAQSRLIDVFAETQTVPMLQTGGKIGAWPGDADFRPEFQDEYGYAMRGYETPHTRQTGHFLTAVAMGNTKVVPEWVLIRSIMGHEVLSDAVTPIPQFFAVWTKANPVFRSAVENFESGDMAARDVDLSSWYASTDNILRGRGNSLEDLRLSVVGWSLGRQIRDARIITNQQAAIWMAEHLAINYQ
jgi:RHS repeat-associated protein